MLITSHPLYRRALHEAAHAVVAHLLGIDIHKITIVPGNAALGHCLYDHSPAIPLDTVEEAAMALAGACIESRVYGNMKGIGPDLRLVMQLLAPLEVVIPDYSDETFSEESFQREYATFQTLPATREVVTLSYRLVDTHRKAIEELAVLLVDVKHIDNATDIYDIIAELTNNESG